MLAICAGILAAQTKQAIISSGGYYYGESVSEQEQEARDKALQRLIEQIAVKVSSFNERTIVETNADLKDTYKNILNTYSNATLRNVLFLKQQTDKGVEVFCYIAKEEVAKIFEERKTLVRRIVDKGWECVQNGNIADGLKYYYFAVILMNSIPEKVIEHQSNNLVVEIPVRINAIIANTTITMLADKKLSDTEREIQLRVTTFSKPVQQLDFSFWDGSSQVAVRAQDGVGAFYLYGASTSFDKLNVEILYKYYEAREEISEVADLWNLVVKPSFKNSQVVNLREKKKKPEGERTARSSIRIELTNKDRSPVAEQIVQETEKFINLLALNNIESVRAAYKTDRFLSEKVAGLLKYNAPRIINEPVKADINKTMTGWEVRKIRMITSHPTLNRQGTEYLILDFDGNGTLYDVNFGTFDQLYEQFVQQSAYGDDWGNRQVMIKFVERYRTAFMTRNMAMLDSLFADEAVIIIGRELKKGKKRDDFQYTKLNESQPDYSYTQYTKQQYLKNQKRVFESQNDIVLGFSTFKISRKNDSSGTYGISMKQHYTSSTYADGGHLFLLVDFLQEQPQIYVRSWQPKEWNDNAIISLSNFKLNK